MADQEMAACPNVPVKIALSSGLGGAEGFESVKKYQKTENLLNEILLKYAELTGSAEAIKGSSHTRTAAFYSPAGGTGKSVLALGMAAAGARTGCKTLYLKKCMLYPRGCRDRGGCCPINCTPSRKKG